jgi:hypothetical protein
MRLRRSLAVSALTVWAVLAVSPAAFPVAGMRSLWVGDRVESFMRQPARGKARLWTPGVPTVVIFWARWSPQSVMALRDIVSAEPRSAARWEIVPINVDRAAVSPRESTAIDAVARKMGYQGPVWYDAGFELSRRWGVVAVPTVIVTGLGGAVELAQAGWTSEQRDRIISTYFGTVNDTTPPVAVDSLLTRCRRDLAHSRFLWRHGAGDSAIALAARVQAACSTTADAPLLLAWWRWEKKDTLGARGAATAAIKADSTDPWSWVTLGAISERCGQVVEARRLAERALGLDSIFAPAWMIVARSSLEAGDTLSTRVAIAALERLSRHDPDLAVTRARLQEQAGDPRGAVAYWRAAVEGRLRERETGLFDPLPPR